MFVQCICVVWYDDERKGEGETQCQLIACSSRKAPRGQPGLTSPSDGRIAINSTICLLNIHTRCGRVWNLIQACDVKSNDQKVYISTPPSSEVENFQVKIYYPAADRTPDLLNQRQTCYHLSQCGELNNNCKFYYFLNKFSYVKSFRILIHVQ